MDETTNKRLGELIMRLAEGEISVLSEIADIVERVLMSIGNAYYNNTPFLANDISITQNRMLIGQHLNIVDTAFYYGASGGPVLDKKNKVVGVIDRGNGIGEEEANYSAFTPIKPLL